MTGWHKVFDMGAVEHALIFFIGRYQDSWIPIWLLWGLGTVIPFVELGVGTLLLMGWKVREALITLGFLLLVVTYGHLLAEPFWEPTSHVLPRVALMITLLALPRASDHWSMDELLRRRSPEEM